MESNKYSEYKSYFFEYETYIFDFDGTLVLSNEIKKEGFYQCIKDFNNGYKLLDEIKNNSVKNDRFHIFKEFALKVSKDYNEAEKYYKKFLIEYEKYTIQKIKRLSPIKGSIELLAKLKKDKKKVYINSATPFDPLNKTINAIKINQYFDKILGMENNKINNLKEIQNHSQSSKSLMIMIGDGSDDKNAAEKFNIDFYPVGKMLTGDQTNYSYLI